jgi:hypothetical protein
MDGRRVENGIERLSEAGYTMDRPDEWNRHMFDKAADRSFVRTGWEGVSFSTSLEVRNVVSVEDRRNRTFLLKNKYPVRVAEAVFKGLVRAELIDEAANLSRKDYGSGISFYLSNASERDSRLYAVSLKQAMSPIIYPKYMVRLGFIFKRYIAVPDALASRKENALIFEECFKEKTRLIYTNTDEGKRLLLDIRLKQGLADKNDVSMIRKLI